MLRIPYYTDAGVGVLVLTLTDCRFDLHAHFLAQATRLLFRYTTEGSLNRVHAPVYSELGRS